MSHRLAKTYFVVVDGTSRTSTGRRVTVDELANKTLAMRLGKRKARREFADGATVELRAESRDGAIVDRVRMVVTSPSRVRWQPDFET